jgi:hypothetical protein
MELPKLVGSLEVWKHSKGVLQENLVILMISSDSLLGEPHEYMEVSKVMGSLEVQERMRVYLKTPELRSHPCVILLQEPMVHGVVEKNWGGVILSPSSYTPRREPTRT